MNAMNCENPMDYEIRTIYCRADIKGFYDVFLTDHKKMRMVKNITKASTAALATFFWGLAAWILIKNLLTHNIQLILGKAPLVLVLILLGGWMALFGRNCFDIRVPWAEYPYRGEELVYHFYPKYCVLTQHGTEIYTSYTSITRLYEDRHCLYLFTSPRIAYVLPKRDFKEKVDAFRKDIMAATGLQMEHK